MNELKVKVCGMRERKNISDVAAEIPDYLGFIFYSNSSRFVGLEPRFEENIMVSTTIKKVGVFVDELPEKVIETCRHFNFNLAQLHGHESPGYCQQIKKAGINVMKAFSVNATFDFKILEEYRNCCTFFLFDTKGNVPGGTGIKFDWRILKKYHLQVPFFLSGGIRLEDLNSIKEFYHPMLYGVDINSGFEILPALKDVDKVRQFIAGIKTIN